MKSGLAYSQQWPAVAETVPQRLENPLRAFFDARRDGRGIWKWDHYLDAYHRHFERFRGREVHIVEIGVYSGGSLDMWRHYFGPNCRVYGVDIQDSCKVYEDDSVRIFIGDQADRDFWRRFRSEVPVVDIVIDDGGHIAVQQVVALEELLPHLRPGGIYATEDIHGVLNGFGSYVGGLIHTLNAARLTHNLADAERRLTSPSTGFQSHIRSIHCYPYLVMIEKMDAPVGDLVCAKHGTQWEPFLR